MVSLFSPAKHLSFSEVKELPALSFFQDLNINIYADKFSSSEVTEPLLAYFNYFPETIEDSRYRQEVATDLSDPDILESVSHFISGIGVAERYLQYSEKVTSSLQTWKWRLDTIIQYYDTIERFCMALNENPPKSKAFYNLHSDLFTLLSDPEIQKVRKKADDLQAQFDKLQFHMVINKERATLDFQYSEDDYCSEIRSEFTKTEDSKDEHTFTESPFGDMLISPLEEFILDQFIKRDRILFRDLETFCGVTREVISEDILDLIRELRFYTMNLEYIEKMRKNDFRFVFPEICSEREVFLDDCYDIVLAAKNHEEKLEVVLNDISKSAEEKAIIVTGPNQGGKTTLARAFGQCFYFGMMGFPVAASVAKIPFVNRIFTQFASVAGSGVEGRLEHEIFGVREVLNTMSNNSLVIFNELFTSAPTIDALTMCRDLLNRLINRSAICFVVTHTFELAFDSDDYVSLVATVVEDGSYRRTYRIIRKRADGVAYANSIVGKYKLDFEHINYRLGKR